MVDRRGVEMSDQDIAFNKWFQKNYPNIATLTEVGDEQSIGFRNSMKNYFNNLVRTGRHESKG